MRTPLVVSLTLAAAFAAAPAQAHAKVVACGSPATTVLFWPKGHNAVPGVGFPKIPTPHIELYRPGATYPGANFFLYVDAKGVIDPSVACGSAPTAKAGAVKHAKTITKTKAVTCTAAGAMAYDVKKTKHGVTIAGRVGRSTTFRIAVRSKGSSLTYDRSVCHAVKTPH